VLGKGSAEVNLYAVVPDSLLKSDGVRSLSIDFDHQYRVQPLFGEQCRLKLSDARSLTFFFMSVCLNRDATERYYIFKVILPPVSA